MKRIGFAALLALSCSAAFAVPPTYEYYRTIDLGTTAAGVFRCSTVVPDATGKLYSSNNQSDEIGYFDPLTANVPADVALVWDAATPADPFGNSSFQGITIDASGDIYASGVNRSSGPDPTITYLMRVVPTGPGTWTKTFVTGVTGVHGGCSAVGAATLALAEFYGGGVSFFSVNTGTNAATQIGTTVLGGAGDAKMVVADTTSNTIYQSVVPTGGVAGRVDRFTLTAGPSATYSAGANSVVAPFASSVLQRAQPNNYQQISLNKAAGVLCLSSNPGTSGVNTFKLFDLNAGGNNLVPYQTIDGSTTPDGAFGTGKFAYGHAFFTVAGTDYLFLMVSNQTDTWTGLVFKKVVPVSAVDDWALFQ